MSRAIEIIDPEYVRKISRQRKILVLSALISFCIFAYPVAQDYYSKWETLNAARKLGLFLTMLKSRAILNKMPIEARFQLPSNIEVYEVSSCGPNAKRSKLWDTPLSSMGSHAEFVSEAWLRQNTNTREPVLQRYCYDPLYGSSVLADGLVHGGIFLIHHQDFSTQRADHAVQLTVEGPSGDLELE